MSIAVQTTYPSLYAEAGILDTLTSTLGEMVWPSDQGPLQNILGMAEFGASFFLPGWGQIIYFVASALGLSLGGLGAWFDKLLGLKTVSDLTSINLSEAAQKIIGSFSSDQLNQMMDDSVQAGVFQGADGPAVAEGGRIPLGLHKTADDDSVKETRQKVASERQAWENKFRDVEPEEMGDVRTGEEPREQRLRETYMSERATALKDRQDKINQTLATHSPANPLNNEGQTEQFAREQYNNLNKSMGQAQLTAKQKADFQVKADEAGAKWKSLVAKRLANENPLQISKKALDAKKAWKTALVDRHVGVSLWPSKGDIKGNLTRTFRTRGAKGSLVTGIIALLQGALHASGGLLKLTGKIGLGIAKKHPLLAAAAVVGGIAFGVHALHTPGQPTDTAAKQVIKVGQNPALNPQVGDAVRTQEAGLAYRAPKNPEEKLGLFVNSLIGAPQ